MIFIKRCNFFVQIITLEFKKIRELNEEPLHFYYEKYIELERKKYEQNDENTNNKIDASLNECLTSQNIDFRQLTFQVCDGEINTYLRLIKNYTCSEIVLLQCQKKLLAIL